MQHSITLGHYFFNASLPAQFIFLVLASFSLYSWVVFIQRFFLFRALHKNCTQFEKSFWSNIKLVELYEQLPEPLPPENLSTIFHAGFSEFSQLKNSNCPDFNIILKGVSRAMAIAEFQANTYLTKQSHWLRFIINSAPLFGLAGTLLGITSTLLTLNDASAINALLLITPGIAEALVSSIMSLVVALSALIFYYINEYQSHQLMCQYHIFQEEFLALLLRQSYEEPHEKTSI